VSFLDPYSRNRRVPLLLIGRIVLLALLGLLGWAGWMGWKALFG
jgi:hypothetical protein